MLLPRDAAVDVRMGLAEACDACREALLRSVEPPNSAPKRLTEPSLASLAPDERPVVVAMQRALHRLATGLAERSGAQLKTAESHARAVFVPDAFTNPEHVRFALKTTIAAMAAYIIYTGLAGRASDSLDYMFLRSAGDPWRDDAQADAPSERCARGRVDRRRMHCLRAPQDDRYRRSQPVNRTMSAVFAWVATSSERLAYAGMQMALAFYLDILQGYGPATDLTVLRDRMAGMLLGNVLMSVVFSVIWPVTAAAQAREALANALRASAALLIDQVPHADTGRRLAVARAIAKARQLMSLAMFETDMLPAHPARSAIGPTSLDDLDLIAGAVFVVAEQDTGEAAAETLHSQDATIAAWFSTCAERLTEGRPLPPLLIRRQSAPRSTICHPSRRLKSVPPSKRG